MNNEPWAWWPRGHEAVRILARLGSGAEETAQVVVSSRGAVTRVPTSELAPISIRAWAPEELTWRAAACRALAAMAPLGAAATHNHRIEPLPHQVVALERALDRQPIRLLFADEVGLGKTIEAGMVIAELKARGAARRVLIVAPKGVQLQWVSEMAQHFGEEFALVGPGGIPVDVGINPWTTFSQVVCSPDSIKPISARKGWTPERIEEYNSLRFRAAVEAGWDLVVFDEAHHVSGSTDDVARHRLAVRLTKVAPHVLLLSATPHSGKSDAFARLLGLLDERFTHGLPLARENVAPVVVRSDKRRATDVRGQPLFKPRTTRLRVVPYGDRRVEEQLYEAMTGYVRFGYQRAKSEKRPAVGFLVLLMQRLASSSTAALLSALELRLAAIVTEGTQLALFPETSEEWGDLSGEEQVEALKRTLGAAWGNELAEVEVLISLAQGARAEGIDAKARDLLALIDDLARRESDPSLKVVVFTEFTKTQAMLLDLLGGAGISAVAINGGMNIHERATVQEEFRSDARALVSTDAGGEGVNLQFAHVIINYDLPWSPSRIEQRIGRVDRIGQTHPVHAINMAMEHSVDARVLEVLERKLAIILAELGADKAGDILNSADHYAPDLYAAAVAGGDIADAGDEFASATLSESSAAAGFLDLLEAASTKPTIGGGEDPGQWMERASTARSKLPVSGDEHPAAAGNLPEVSPAEPVPIIRGATPGTFSLWEVTGVDPERTCNAVFLTDDGGARPDLADRIWDDLIAGAEVRTSVPLGSNEWDALWDAGWGYTVRPTNGSGQIDQPPALVLRLLVRVEP
jgi:superfamily II DNA or RNA helicase